MILLKGAFPLLLASWLEPEREGMAESLVQMLEATQDGVRGDPTKGNRVRVAFVATKKEAFFDIPRARWYSLTVAEFLPLVQARAPLDHPQGALFLSCRGREQILSEGSLLTAYDISSPDAVLLFKAKPRLINVLFHKQCYVDSDVTVEDSVPLIHYALARNEWVDGDEKVFSTGSATHFPLPTHGSDSLFGPEVLKSSQIHKLKSSARLLDDSGGIPTFFLTNDASPLLACMPSPTNDLIPKAPKPKRCVAPSFLREQALIVCTGQFVIHQEERRR